MFWEHSYFLVVTHNSTALITFKPETYLKSPKQALFFTRFHLLTTFSVSFSRNGAVGHPSWFNTSTVARKHLLPGPSGPQQPANQ